MGTCQSSFCEGIRETPEAVGGNEQGQTSSQGEKKGVKINGVSGPGVPGQGKCPKS